MKSLSRRNFAQAAVVCAAMGGAAAVSTASASEAFLPVHDNKGATAHIGPTEGPGVAALTFKVKDNPRL